MTNAITAAGIALVREFEGLRLEPYRDLGGIETIGYGHVVRPGEDFAALTEAGARDLLVADLADWGAVVLNHVRAPLTDNQLSAVASLCFNLGTGPLAGTLGTLLNAGRYGDAADQFPRWTYAAGRRIDGLVRRRAAERALFNTPDGDPTDA